MKKDKSKKFAILAGLFFFIPAIISMPSIISINILTGSDLTNELMLKGLVVLAVESLISIALSIALFVRKKNASFVVITASWLVFYIARCIALTSGFSINIFLNIFSLLIILWLFMINCLPKLKSTPMKKTNLICFHLQKTQQKHLDYIMKILNLLLKIT